MSLEKFLAMLSARALHLCRLDNFKDTWEGVWPMSIFARGQTQWADEQRAQFRSMVSAIRRSLFVSCWHSSDTESASLWSQYSGTSGIAIRSTVGKLRGAIRADIDATVGAVDYIDFSSPPPASVNAVVAAFRKRQSFSSEGEIRLLVADELSIDGNEMPRCARDRILLDVDLEVLIDAVYLSPESPGWLLPAVVELLRRFGLEKVQLIKSDLYDPMLH